MIRLVPFCLMLCAASMLRAQEQPVAFTGARIIPIAGAEIDNGVLVVQSGKIVAVGAANVVQVPQNAQRRDVAGKIIMPGLVDTHSHIGGPGGGGGSVTIQSDKREGPDGTVSV